jgi:hypothetical protein
VHTINGFSLACKKVDRTEMGGSKIVIDGTDTLYTGALSTTFYYTTIT